MPHPSSLEASEPFPLNVSDRLSLPSPTTANPAYAQNQLSHGAVPAACLVLQGFGTPVLSSPISRQSSSRQGCSTALTTNMPVSILLGLCRSKWPPGTSCSRKSPELKVSGLTLPLTCCATLSKSLFLSGLQFLRLGTDQRWGWCPRFRSDVQGLSDRVPWN